MDMYDINLQKRIVSGKSEIRRIKNEGMIPGVLYSGDGSIPVMVEEDRLRSLISKHGEEITLNAIYNGHTIRAAIQEVQRDPINREIQHIDLMPVDSSSVKYLQ